MKQSSCSRKCGASLISPGGLDAHLAVRDRDAHDGMDLFLDPCKDTFWILMTGQKCA